MSEKRVNHMGSPDLNKMQAVIIDKKTTIYIAKNADPDEARKRYLNRMNQNNKIPTE